MTIIVTGGAGFIGSNFIFHMLAAHPGYRIVCLDKLTYAGNLSTLKSVLDNPDFRFVKADICDREAVFKLFEEEKPEIVVNFAAESHVDRSIEDPGIFLQTNIIGTATLMAASTALSATTKFQPTRFTATCLSTDPTCFLPKRRLSTLAVPIRQARLQRIYLSWPITELTGCPCR